MQFIVKKEQFKKKNGEDIQKRFFTGAIKSWSRRGIIIAFYKWERYYR
jgi:hypothetical protein